MTLEDSIRRLPSSLEGGNSTVQQLDLRAGTASLVLDIPPDDFLTAVNHLIVKRLAPIRWAHGEVGRQRRIGERAITLTPSWTHPGGATDA